MFLILLDFSQTQTVVLSVSSAADKLMGFSKQYLVFYCCDSDTLVCTVFNELPTASSYCTALRILSKCSGQGGEG